MPYIEHISSIKHEKIIETRDLTTSKGRKRSEKCQLRGREQIEWAIQAKVPIDYVLVLESKMGDEFIKILDAHTISYYGVNEGIIKKALDTNYTIPFIGIAHIQWNAPLKTNNSLIMVLNHVQDFGNIGTICRTARAFGVKDIVFTDEDADPFFTKSIDASRGTVFSMRYTHFSSDQASVENLKKLGYQIVATSPYGSTLQALADLGPKPTALVIGNEANGISKEFMDNADVLVQIPMSSSVESLNVAVATGISIYELQMRLIFMTLETNIKKTLGRDLGLASYLIRQVLDKELKQVSSFSAQQVVFLMILKCDQKMGLEQVSHDTGYYTDNERSQFLQELHLQELIKFVNENEITLTLKGEQTLAALWAVVERCQQEILNGFSEEEYELLRKYIQRIQANCMKILEL